MVARRLSSLPLGHDVRLEYDERKYYGQTWWRLGGRSERRGKEEGEQKRGHYYATLVWATERCWRLVGRVEEDVEFLGLSYGLACLLGSS